jgi:hypothetical protein
MDHFFDIIILILCLFVNIFAFPPNDSLLLGQLCQSPKDTVSQTFFFYGFTDAHHNDITNWVGYDSSKTGEKVFRTSEIVENRGLKPDTLFCEKDTIFSKTLIQCIRSIVSELPEFQTDTNPPSKDAKDTCYGRGFLFSITSQIGNKTRVYQNCCSKCTIELLNKIESKNIFKYSKPYLIDKALKNLKIRSTGSGL